MNVEINYHGYTHITWSAHTTEVVLKDYTYQYNRRAYKSMRRALSTILADKTMTAEEVVAHFEKCGPQVLTGHVDELKRRIAQENSKGRIVDSTTSPVDQPD